MCDGWLQNSAWPGGAFPDVPVCSEIWQNVRSSSSRARRRVEDAPRHAHLLRAQPQLLEKGAERRIAKRLIRLSSITTISASTAKYGQKRASGAHHRRKPRACSKNIPQSEERIEDRVNRPLTRCFFSSSRCRLCCSSLVEPFDIGDAQIAGDGQNRPVDDRPATSRRFRIGPPKPGQQLTSIDGRCAADESTRCR